MHLSEAEAALDLPCLTLPPVLSPQGMSDTAAHMAVVGALVEPCGTASCQGMGSLASCRVHAADASLFCSHCQWWRM